MRFAAFWDVMVLISLEHGFILSFLPTGFLNSIIPPVFLAYIARFIYWLQGFLSNVYVLILYIIR